MTHCFVPSEDMWLAHVFMHIVNIFEPITSYKFSVYSEDESPKGVFFPNKNSKRASNWSQTIGDIISSFSARNNTMH